VRLGEKNYRVSELNGAMFGPCGTRMYAGNHDGRLNVWEYPIKRVLPEESMGEGEKKEEDGVQEVEDQEDDEDAPMRRSNENRASAEPMETDKAQASTQEDVPMDAEDDAPPAEDDGKEEKEDVETTEVKPDTETTEGQGDAETQEGKVDTETQEEKGDPSMQEQTEKTETASEGETGGDAVTAVKDEDVKMEDVEQATPVEEATKPATEFPTDAKPDVPSPDTAVTTEATQKPEPTAASTEVSVVSSPAAPSAPEPVAPPAQMLKYLYGQVVNSGCLNCIDIDPRRRYIATGGSEGMVNLCQVGEWIGVASFDSYT
jgi:hypothetical protein